MLILIPWVLNCACIDCLQFSRMTSSSAAVVPDPDEGSFSHVLNRDLYKHRDKIVGMKTLCNNYLSRQHTK